MTDDKGIKLLVKRLQSGNTKDILFTIKQIRSSGEPLILPYIFDLMIDNPSKEISDALIELLNELKNKACINEIIYGLQTDKYNSIIKELLTSCWSSGLDYSAHLELFVKIFIKNDFLIAFEAFTVIESFEKQYTADTINSLIADLKNNMNNFSEEKRNLMVELVHLLESKKLLI